MELKISTALATCSHLLSTASKLLQIRLEPANSGRFPDKDVSTVFPGIGYDPLGLLT